MSNNPTNNLLNISLSYYHKPALGWPFGEGTFTLQLFFFQIRKWISHLSHFNPL